MYVLNFNIYAKLIINLIRKAAFIGSQRQKLQVLPRIKTVWYSLCNDVRFLDLMCNYNIISFYFQFDLQSIFGTTNGRSSYLLSFRRVFLLVIFKIPKRYRLTENYCAWTHEKELFLADTTILFCEICQRQYGKKIQHLNTNKRMKATLSRNAIGT